MLYLLCVLRSAPGYDTAMRDHLLIYRMRTGMRLHADRRLLVAYASPCTILRHALVAPAQIIRSITAQSHHDVVHLARRCGCVMQQFRPATTRIRTAWRREARGTLCAIIDASYAVIPGCAPEDASYRDEGGLRGLNRLRQRAWYAVTRPFTGRA